jgi:hypothetical protein
MGRAKCKVDWMSASSAPSGTAILALQTRLSCGQNAIVFQFIPLVF